MKDNSFNMTYIIGIGGVRAVGKSYVSRELATVIRGDVISLGRERDRIRGKSIHRHEALNETVTDQETTEKAYHILKEQSEMIAPEVTPVVMACRNKKSSLIIEGAHMFPGLYSDCLNAIFFLGWQGKDRI